MHFVLLVCLGFFHHYCERRISLKIYWNIFIFHFLVCVFCWFLVCGGFVCLFVPPLTKHIPRHKLKITVVLSDRVHMNSLVGKVLVTLLGKKGIIEGRVSCSGRSLPFSSITIFVPVTSAMRMKGLGEKVLQSCIIRWCCILEPWEEIDPFHFIFKFPNEHNAHLKCLPEFLWTELRYHGLHFMC